MSDSTMFDTHRHVKELAAHGLSEACAESIVKVVQEGFTHHVATKADLTELRAGLQEQLTKLDGRVTNIETNMATKNDLASAKTDIVKWNLGTILTLLALGIAAFAAWPQG